MATPTPLDAFIESLKRSQGEVGEVPSSSRHVHAPTRVVKPDAAKQRDELRDGSVTYSEGPASLDEIVVEPALPRNPVYWRSMNGQIHGPCPVTEMAKMGRPGCERFWLCVEEQGRTVWIQDTLLVSRDTATEQVRHGISGGHEGAYV